MSAMLPLSPVSAALSVDTYIVDDLTFIRDWLRLGPRPSYSTSSELTSPRSEGLDVRELRFMLLAGLPMLPMPAMKPAACRCTVNMTVSRSEGR